MNDYWISNNLIEGNETDYLLWIKRYLIDKLFWWNCVYKEQKANKICKLIEKCGLNNYVDDLRKGDRFEFKKLRKMAKK